MSESLDHILEAAHPTVLCDWCNRPFVAARYLRKRGLARFCSDECRVDGLRIQRELRQDAVQLSNGDWTLVSPEDLEYARGSSLDERSVGA